jgi:membrane protein implicated in regulation of membrane protease activity
MFMSEKRSARTFLWFSFILLVVGGAIADPTAGFALSVLAGLSAVATIALGKKRLKLIGVLALALSVALALASWPAARSHQQKYREHIKKEYAQ